MDGWSISYYLKCFFLTPSFSLHIFFPTNFTQPRFSRYISQSFSPNMSFHQSCHKSQTIGSLIGRFSLSLSISMAQIREMLHPWLQQIWEVLHPWLHPTLQIHDSRLFLYKWALEIPERGKSCRSFFVLGAIYGTIVFRLGILLLQGCYSYYGP
ncbi:uncharacterized protein LOC131000126 [Salvia miltiorrhiza]|uniref:uncharacterized protein LOC131000126 n=1 Tax=Salvia miltiorrhiza TaxID=226208 RepID=UPI0025AD662C|nr:uncharacterized protein LOC131000126 [Salvia miltiorrhiza]